jgi:hypothetical protein
MYKKPFSWPKLPLIISVLVCINLKASGLPMPQATTLPAPPAGSVDPEDIPLMGTVLGLTVYQDYQDKNQYYYVPPFRILSFDQGAAGLVVHSVKVEKIFEADEAMNNMKSEEETPPDSVVNDPIIVIKRQDLLEASDRLKKLEQKFADKIEKLEETISEAEDKLGVATQENNTRLMDYYQKFINDKNNEIIKKTEGINKERDEVRAMKDDIKAYLDESIENWKRRKLFPVVTDLAGAGISIDTRKYPTAEELVVAINDALDELKKSSGGFLSMSIYSGFTDRQVHDISILKNKYWPHIKLSLLASEDLEFRSLTEIQNKDKKSRENTMFRAFKGSGGYHGATVNFDLTIDGAISLSRRLGPFIVPVEVTANITEKMLPFRAVLDCDFSTGYQIKGRADIRDGLVIYDQDITNTINKEDISNGKCKVEVLEGDESSAHVEALKELDARLTAMNVQKTKLNQAEADRFYQGILADLAHRQNTADGDDGYTWEWVDYIDVLGYGAVAVGVLSEASNFYWHTSIYDTTNISKLKFKKEISYNGHKTVRKPLPTTLCLYFSASKNAYDRCTRAQEEVAENAVKASELAAASPACQDTKTLYECGENRAQSAPELKPAAEEKIVDNIVELN